MAINADEFCVDEELAVLELDRDELKLDELDFELDE